MPTPFFPQFRPRLAPCRRAATQQVQQASPAQLERYLEGVFPPHLLGMSLTTPEKVWQLQAASHAKAKSEPIGNHDRQPLVCASMNTLNEGRMPEMGLSGLMSGE